MRVHNSGPMTISVAQLDKRCFAHDSKYNYCHGRLIVAEIVTGKYLKYIAGTHGKLRDLHLEIAHLKQGDYFVFVELDN